MEYSPLIPAAPEDGTDNENMPAEHCTAHSASPRYPVAVSVLVALVAICAAAAFQLSLLFDSDPLRSSKDVESRLRRSLPSPILEEARNTMAKRKLKCGRGVKSSTQH